MVKREVVDFNIKILYLGLINKMRIPIHQVHYGLLYNKIMDDYFFLGLKSHSPRNGTIQVCMVFIGSSFIKVTFINKE